jgi:ketosteroid isomerase-like protein
MAALSRHDPDAMLKDWADDAIMGYSGNIPGVSGTYAGIEAIRDFYRRDAEQFPKLDITPTHIAITVLLDLTGENVAIVSWDAGVTNRSGYSLRNRGVNVMRIRRGKVQHARVFTFADISLAYGSPRLRSASRTAAFGVSPTPTSRESSPRSAVAMSRASRSWITTVTQNSRRGWVGWRCLGMRAEPGRLVSPATTPHDGRTASSPGSDCR